MLIVILGLLIATNAECPPVPKSISSDPYGFGFYGYAHVALSENLHAISFLEVCEYTYKSDQTAIDLCKAGVYDADSNKGRALKCLATHKRELSEPLKK